jgi:hypothetical protein
MANAGWNATSKRAKTSPGLSLICGKVSPCLSMNPWKESSSPVQATPTKLTVSPNFAAAASTEGASRLQKLQVGAQNQNTVGLPASELASSSPPPTNGALNCRAPGTAMASTSAGTATVAASAGAAGSVSGVATVSMAGAVLAELPSELLPQAASRSAPAANAGRRRVDRIRAP